MKKIIALLLFIISLFSFAYAEDVWILCQPDSYVNIRQFPNKYSNCCGYMECGWKAETQGKTKGSYIYLYSLTNESGDGWLSKGYITYSEPIITEIETNIYSNGRVACWRYIGGPRRCWVKDGDSITAYAITEEWSVTNKGFIKTKYLGIDYDLLSKRMDESETNGEPDGLYYEDDI